MYIQPGFTHPHTQPLTVSAHLNKSRGMGAVHESDSSSRTKTGDTTTPVDSPKTGETKNQEKEWTVLFYLDGNNDIEADIVNSFLTLEEVADHDKMNLVAQLGRAPQHIAHSNGEKDGVDGDWDGVRQYILSKGNADPYPRQMISTALGTHDGKIDSILVKDLGREDMSDKYNLKKFLEWGMENFPAKNYMVVLANHGAGFLGALSDYKSKKNMGLREISEAFDETWDKIGKMPDVLVMDGCVMAQAEVVGELQYNTKYYVGSEDYNYDCLPFQKTFRIAQERMDGGEEISPKEMMKILADQCSQFSRTPTISVIDMENMPRFTSAMKGLADSLLATDTDPEIIRQIISVSTQFAEGNDRVKPYSDYRDLKNFAHLLMTDPRIEDDRLKSSASGVIRAMDKDFVVEERHDGIYENYNPDDDTKVGGLTVYLPTAGFDYSHYRYIFPSDTNKDEYEDTYRNLEFVKETRWDKVIDKFAYKPAKRWEAE